MKWIKRPLSSEKLSSKSQDYLNSIRNDFDALWAIDPGLSKPYLKKQIQSENFQNLRQENRESGEQFQYDKQFLEDFEEKQKYIQENQHKINLLKKKLDKVENNNDISQIEQQRKSQALQFLKDNDLETPAHIAMINNVQFTKESITIGGISRAHENAKASDFGLSYTQDTQKNSTDYIPQVFKGEGAYADEDYFNFAMVDKIVKQGAKVPSYQDMRKTLAALPWGPIEGTPPSSPNSTGRQIGSAQLMSILLGTKMSGDRSDGERNDCGSSGFLWSRSEYGSDDAWACDFGELRGELDYYNRECALPLRLLV